METPSRVPLRGSCHCGHVQYILHLHLPHPPQQPPLPPPPSRVQRFYRCNCTVCHKSGHFHVRPRDPTSDFLLLSPLDPFAELGHYRTREDGVLRFFFCKGCGVQPFIFAGEGEVVTISQDLLNDDSKGDQEGGSDPVQRRVWRPTPGGGHPTLGHYLSVNGHTIDAGQERWFDMRELTEGKKVMYCDCLSDPAEEAPLTYERPQKGGCY